MEYTKGDWRIDDMPLPSRGFMRITSCTSREIALISKPQGRTKYYSITQLPKEMQSNTHLISAAPDMYEALNDVNAFLTTGQFNNDPYVLKLRKQVQEAIAKVEGK